MDERTGVAIPTYEVIWNDDWNEKELHDWFVRRWVEIAQTKRSQRPWCFDPLCWFGDVDRRLKTVTLSLLQLKEWPVVWIGLPEDGKARSQRKDGGDA
jgi:hypothetical protein